MTDLDKIESIVKEAVKENLDPFIAATKIVKLIEESTDNQAFMYRGDWYVIAGSVFCKCPTTVSIKRDVCGFCGKIKE